MQKNKLRLKPCGRITAVVILMSFLKFPMFAEQPTEQPPNLNESGMRLYSDLEVDFLIDEISAAALEGIEQAAGEAAKAAVLSVIEREAAAMREAAHQQAEATRWRIQAEINALAITQTKKAGIKNAIIAGVICLLGGLAFGVGGTLIIGGR
jgi:hypothetical protein